MALDLSTVAITLDTSGTVSPAEQGGRAVREFGGAMDLAGGQSQRLQRLLLNLSASAAGISPTFGHLAGILSQLAGFGAKLGLIAAPIGIVIAALRQASAPMRGLQREIDAVTKAIEQQARSAGAARDQLALLGLEASRLKDVAARGTASTAEILLNPFSKDALTALGRFVTLKGFYGSAELQQEKQANVLRAEANARAASVAVAKQHVGILGQLASSFEALTAAGLADVTVQQRYVSILDEARTIAADTSKDFAVRAQALGIVTSATTAAAEREAARTAVLVAQTDSLQRVREAEDRAYAAQTRGAEAAQAMARQQEQAGKIVQLAQQYWDQYRATLPAGTKAIEDVRLAMERGNRTAAEYIEKAQRQIAVITEADRVTASIVARETGAIQRKRDLAAMTAQLTAVQRGGVDTLTRLQQAQAEETAALVGAQAQWDSYREKLGLADRAYADVLTAAEKYHDEEAGKFVATNRAHQASLAAVQRQVESLATVYQDTQSLDLRIQAQQRLSDVTGLGERAERRAQQQITLMNALWERREDIYAGNTLAVLQYLAALSQLLTLEDEAAIKAARTEAGQRFLEQSRENARAFQEIFSEAFKDFFAYQLTGWEAFFFAIQQLAARSAQQIRSQLDYIRTENQRRAQQGLPLISEGGLGLQGNILSGAGVGLGIGLASQSALTGTLGGAAAGFVVGGPIGALVGAVAGLVSSLIGASEDSARAAEQMLRAKEQWALALEDWVALSSPRGLVGQGLAELKRRYIQSVNELVDTFGPGYRREGATAPAERTEAEIRQDLNRAIREGNEELAEAYRMHLELNQAYRAAQEALEAQIQLQRVRATEDLEVERLRLTGQGAEAEMMALRRRNQRELDDLVKSFGTDALTEADLALLKLLQTVHDLREETLAFEQQLSTSRQQTDIRATFRIRGLRAGGDETGAAITEAQFEYLRGIREIDDWLRTGVITTEEFAEFLAILTDEMDQAIDTINEMVAAQALARQRQQEDIAQSFAVRGLRAAATAAGLGGDEDAATALTRQANIAQAQFDFIRGMRELDDWFKEGLITTDQYADYQAILNQELENAVNGVNDLIEAERQLAEQRKREGAAIEDLTVRHIRATVGDEAAAEAAAYYAEQRAILTAIEEGFSEATIDFIRQVFREEKQLRDETRRVRQQAAFDAAFPTTAAATIAEQATRVNLAVGVSETTAGRLAGLAASQLAVMNQQLRYQASLPLMLTSLRNIERQLGISSVGPDLVAQDEAGALLLTAGERVAGNPPGNR